jgi:hypothetical protein
VGRIVNSYQGLGGLVASSAKFRTIVGAATATIALDDIHYPYPSDSDTRPWAIIDGGTGTEWEEQIRMSAGGSLMLTIEVPESYYSGYSTDKTKWLAFAGDVDDIMDQMETNSNTSKGDGSNYWNLTAISQAESPYLVLEQAGDPAGQYFTCAILCRWV